MLNYIADDLLLTKDRFIAHGCNSSARFGAGVAFKIKNAFPWAEKSLQEEYQKWIVNNASLLPLGRIYIAAPPNPNERAKYIINCITQSSWGREIGRRYVSYDAVDSCMKAIVDLNVLSSEKKISMPRIGAGLGGGHWPVIEEIIKFRLKDFTVNIFTGKNNESLQSSKS